MKLHGRLVVANGKHGWSSRLITVALEVGSGNGGRLEVGSGNGGGREW